MSETPVGSAENPAKPDPNAPTPDAFHDAHPGITRVSMPDGTYYYVSRTGQLIDPLTYKGQYDSVWNNPIQGIPDIKGKPAMLWYISNGVDKVEMQEQFPSGLGVALRQMGYDTAFINYAVGRAQDFLISTSEGDYFDLNMAEYNYEVALLKEPLMADRYHETSRGGAEPLEGYGFNVAEVKQAFVEALLEANEKDKFKMLQLEEAQKQTEILKALRAEEEKIENENILEYLQRVLQQGAPVSGERSIEDFMTRVLPKGTLVAQSIITGLNIKEQYSRAADIQQQMNQAYINDDLRLYDKLDRQLFQMSNRLENSLLKATRNLESYTPALAEKARTVNVVKSTYKKTYKVPKYKTTALRTEKKEPKIAESTLKKIQAKYDKKLAELTDKLAKAEKSLNKLKGKP